jgi:hypothetical protein
LLGLSVEHRSIRAMQQQYLETYADEGVMSASAFFIDDERVVTKRHNQRGG